MKKIRVVISVLMLIVLLPLATQSFARYGPPDEPKRSKVIQAVVSGYLFIDEDKDGQFDPLERGLSEALVSLEVGGEVASVMTDETGLYTFVARTATTYTIIAPEIEGYIFISETDGIVDGHIEVTTGVPCTENNFGYIEIGTD